MARRHVAFVMLLSLFTSSCAWTRRVLRNVDTTSRIPDPPPYSPGEGVKFCSALAHEATARQGDSSFNGWLLTLLGGGLVTWGTILGPNDSGATVFDKQRGILLTATGLLLAPLAYGAFTSADAAARASAGAGRAMSEPSDVLEYAACLDVRSSWALGTNDANGFAFSQLKKLDAASAQTAQNLKESTNALENLKKTSDELATQLASTLEQVKSKAISVDSAAATLNKQIDAIKTSATEAAALNKAAVAASIGAVDAVKDAAKGQQPPPGGQAASGGQGAAGAQAAPQSSTGSTK